MIQGLGLLEKLATSPLGESFGARSAFEATPTSSATTFAAAMREATERTVATLERAEGVSMQALQGEANTREVVDAVMSAEQSLQAAIAIRDKIITAYLEVSRMAI